jgi:ABC-type uncharacterized transport system permease subunit
MAIVAAVVIVYWLDALRLLPLLLSLLLGIASARVFGLVVRHFCGKGDT